MYSQKRNCAASVPISTLMCLWAISIFPGSVHIFSCSRIGRPILGKYKSLTDTWMLKLGLRPRNSFSGNICFEFSVLCLCSGGLQARPFLRFFGRLLLRQILRLALRLALRLDLRGNLKQVLKLALRLSLVGWPWGWIRTKTRGWPWAYPSAWPWPWTVLRLALRLVLWLALRLAF
jgi:hypothetical protein